MTEAIDTQQNNMAMEVISQYGPETLSSYRLPFPGGGRCLDLHNPAAGNSYVYTRHQCIYAWHTYYGGAYDGRNYWH